MAGGDVGDVLTPLLGDPKAPEFERVQRGLGPYTASDGWCCAHLPPEIHDGRADPCPPQLLRYDVRYVSSVFALFRLRGTAFASRAVWVHVLGNTLVAAIVWAAVFFGCRRPELIDTETIRQVASYASGLVGFVLVFYLSLMVGRWWEMRRDSFGGLWGAIDDLALLLAAHFPGPEAQPLKSLVLRYCLASLELTFMQARGTDGVLAGLVGQGLLTEDEKRKLEELVSKPQAVWVWIAGVFQQLTSRGKLSSRMLVALYSICAHARSCVGRGRGVFAYLDTQLPFSYVHLIAIIVHLSNLLLAVKCGTLAAVASWNLVRPETKRDPVSDMENAQVLLLQVFFVIVVPFFYLAFLEVGASVSDPFGEKFEDFPRAAYRTWVRNECEAFLSAGESPPDEVVRITDELEVFHDDFVQDRIIVV